MHSTTNNLNTGAPNGALVTLRREDYEAIKESNTELHNALNRIEESVKARCLQTDRDLNNAADTIRRLGQREINAYVVAAAGTICGIFLGAMATYLYMRNH